MMHSTADPKENTGYPLRPIRRRNTKVWLACILLPILSLLAGAAVAAFQYGVL